MNKNQNEAIEKLERLCNTLADDVDAMSDKELMAELQEAGEDTDAIAKRMRGLIADAIAKFGRQKMEAARAGYAAEMHQTGYENKVLHWPLSRKRELIQRFAQNDKALQQQLTLAARKEEDSQADMDSFIEDLIDLGVINDEGNLT